MDSQLIAGAAIQIANRRVASIRPATKVIATASPEASAVNSRQLNLIDSHRGGLCRRFDSNFFISFKPHLNVVVSRGF